MKQKQRRQALFGVLIVLAVVAIFVMKNYLNPPRPDPNGKGYYTGPKVNKARTLLVDDDGKVYGPAPGAENGKAAPDGNGTLPPSPQAK